MKKCTLILVVAGLAGWAVAGDVADDQRVLAQTAAARPKSPAPPTAEVTPPETDNLAQAEREARVAATVAQARLELILARKALETRDYQQAARKAHLVLALLKQLPPELDVSVDELQAEGVLAKAARAGVDIESARRDVASAVENELPPLAEDPDLDAKAREAARIARNYQGAPSPDVDARADERLLRERALRRPAVDRYGYRPAREIVDTDALRVREDERVYYQAALEGAYRDSEVQSLVEVDEARIVPGGVISYPPDWPEKMKKREQYRGGMIARTPSWRDKDGREWYIAVYDIHDLIYVPPDFTAPHFDPILSQRDALDRAALRWNSQIFRGWPQDLAAGIPLLRYFGGVDDWAYRGPKYSIERQQQIVELIEAFTGTPEGGAKVVPLTP